MRITYDPTKRDRTLGERGLNFDDAAEVFDGVVVSIPDDRRDYGEERIATFGMLRGRMVVVIWTPRGEARHVISMRKANGRERQRFGQRLGEG